MHNNFICRIGNHVDWIVWKNQNLTNVVIYLKPDIWYLENSEINLSLWVSIKFNFVSHKEIVTLD